MIKKDLNIKKKNQRIASSKKRFLINKYINLENSLFYKVFNKHIWYKKSKVIASFLSIKSEIPTEKINKFIISDGKILCLPVINEKNDGIIFKSFDYGNTLEEGKFGVKEPVSGKSYLPDIILTPCLAFDIYGYRLGYGGGYYDKTISNLNSISHKFLTIGLAYDAQIIEKVPHDHYDQKLNYILTEKQLYEI